MPEQQQTETNNDKEQQQTTQQTIIQNFEEKIANLENLLKIETINCEEQRVYINILKESITNKLNQQQLSEILQKFQSDLKMSKVDLYAYANMMYNQLELQRTEGQMYKQSIAELQSENIKLKNLNIKYEAENKEYTGLNDNLNQQMSNLLQTMEKLQNGKKDLIEENQSMKELIEELQKKNIGIGR
eukprot:TRINITY_DN3134_c0_g1_i1.p1 TRINITY_DN3134_c0_g1~~TRINITY_DN3134_c0_g1_i1.p1  ORF type:complete len:187 (-),score=32.97 TRINITY_DN3134_c0_g1_i1:280-840(-)